MQGVGVEKVIACLEKVKVDVSKPRGDTNFMSNMFARANPAEKQLKDQCDTAIQAVGTPTAAHCPEITPRPR